MKQFFVLSLLCLLIKFSEEACSPACSSGQQCVYDTCMGSTWPSKDAQWEIRIEAQNFLEPDPVNNLSDEENVKRGGPDHGWLHLHRGSSVASSSNLTVTIRNGGTTLSNSAAGIQIRYTIKNIPVSGWISSPFRYEISVNQANFDTDFPYDGIYHLSCEVQITSSSYTLYDFKPYPIFVHILRSGFPVTTMVPVGIDESNSPDDGDASRSYFSPDPVYIDSKSRKWYGYPLNKTMVPWQGPPHLNDLYAEQMMPHTPLFGGAQMWWQDNFHTLPDGSLLPFVRAFPPKHSEEHNGGLRVKQRHERFPAKDGPRSVGWMSTYVGGHIDSLGRFAFAETSGRLGYLYPDGEIITIAGWVTKPGKDPIWYKKSTATVRQNMELRGTWLNGQYPNENGGFHLPLDVAVDPKNENILYVVGFEDHCVWKVEIIDLATHNVQISVFAGDVNHTTGATDGRGTNARFWGPSSIIFDPVCDCMYVADQETGHIRRITRNADVTTIYGNNNVKLSGNIEFAYAPPAVSTNCGSWWNQTCAKVYSNLECGGNCEPDIFLPHTIRVDSKGNIILLEIGYGTIRRINPTTNETKVLARVDMKHLQWTRGWAWMDVDRWGNSGDKDSIYWCKFVGEVFGSSHGNDRGDPGCQYMWKGVTCADSSACTDYISRHRCPEGTTTNMFSENYGYVPPDNTDQKSYLVYTQAWTGHPEGFGMVKESSPPHYPWLVAVDPRGAVILGGGGEHGLVRLRVRRPDDPIPVDSSTSWDHYYKYWNGRAIYEAGSPRAEYGKSPVDPTIGSLNIFGYDGHNYLGLGVDTWGMVNVSDDVMLTKFRVPDLVLNNATARQMTIWFLRSSSGTNSTEQPYYYEYTGWSPNIGGVSSSVGSTSTTATVVGTTGDQVANSSGKSMDYLSPIVLGPAIGGLILIIAIIAIVIFFVRKRRNSSYGNSYSNSYGNNTANENSNVQILPMNVIQNTRMQQADENVYSNNGTNQTAYNPYYNKPAPPSNRPQW